MFGESPVSIRPRPAIMTPTSITFLALARSTKYPTNGDRKPDSTWRRENAPDNTVLETPKSLSIDRKKTVKPCHIASAM